MGKYYNTQRNMIGARGVGGASVSFPPKKWTLIPPEVEGSSEILALVQKGYIKRKLEPEVMAVPVESSVVMESSVVVPMEPKVIAVEDEPSVVEKPKSSWKKSKSKGVAVEPVVSTTGSSASDLMESESLGSDILPE